MRTILGWLAAGVLAAGVVVGLVPLSYHGTSCGVGWHATDAAGVADLQRTLGGAPDDGLTGVSPYSDGCGTRRTVVRLVALPLLLVGAGLAIGAGAAKPRQRGDQPAA